MTIQELRDGLRNMLLAYYQSSVEPEDLDEFGMVKQEVIPQIFEIAEDALDDIVDLLPDREEN